MGDLIRASCQCGLKTKELMVGSGFGVDDSSTYALAYCDHCEKVKSIQVTSGDPRCSKCHRIMTYYIDPDDRFSEISNSIDENRSYYCPRCKSNSLRFEFAGVWD